MSSIREAKEFKVVQRELETMGQKYPNSAAEIIVKALRKEGLLK